MGVGLGHVTRLRPIASELIARGHHVTLAAANLQTALPFFSDLDIPLLQAPYNWTPRFHVKLPFTFTHVLFNCGFAERENLEARVYAWLSLFSLAKPDLLLADHSPGALLAARIARMPAVAIGTGFECPPPESPLPNLRRGMNPDPTKIAEVEHTTLETINGILETFGGDALPSVAALYSEAMDQLLMTFAELDPYEDRRTARYFGTTSSHGGIAPEWPRSGGAKVFVYLKPHDNIWALINHLVQRDCSIIVFDDAYQLNGTVPEYQSCLRVETSALYVEQVANECDLAIVSGGHGTTAAFLLAGKPLLVIPTVLEQALTGYRVARLGAGLSAHFDSLPSVLESVDRVISNDAFSKCAVEFALSHAEHTPADCARQVAARIGQMN
jgi:hypothetical protein